MHDNPYESPSTMGSAPFVQDGQSISLKRIHVLRSGVVLGLLYLLLGLIFAPFFILMALFGPDAESTAVAIGMGVGMFLGYGIMGFIGGVVGALIYNVIASMTGGLMFDIE